jgi:hypothetical protein
MSNPNVPFYQLPKTGTFSYQPFAVGADYKFPDYFSSVFKPTEAQMQAKGTNTTTGGRDQPAFDYQSAGGALPGMPGNMQEYLNFFDALNESNLQKQIKAAQVSQDLSLQGMAAYYPFLSQAARENRQENLLASEIWEDFKARLPASRQNIAASQQGQANLAASGEAGMITALANLQNAQNRMTYRGNTFAVG